MLPDRPDHRLDSSFDPDFVNKYFNRSKCAPKSPFTVSVIGHEESQNSFLGFGRIIGSILVDYYPVPVVEIEDPFDGEVHTILGSECYFQYPPLPDLVAGVAAGNIAIGSIRLYFKQLEADSHSSPLADEMRVAENTSTIIN